MRSDGVHGSLKTTGIATAPQFQLQRTSRGWVRRKKKIPSDINRGAGTGAKERRLVDSPFRIPLVGLCSSLPHARCVDLRPDRNIAVRVIAFSSSYFFLFIRVKGGGASGNAWRRHPSRLFFMAN